MSRPVDEEPHKPGMVKVIVERVVQEVYYLDPNSQVDCAVSAKLQQMVINHFGDDEQDQVGEKKTPPIQLGHRAWKGAEPPVMTLARRAPVARWERMNSLTLVDWSNGRPSWEWKFTGGKKGGGLRSGPVRK